jgi:hypothetical protein
MSAYTRYTIPEIGYHSEYTLNKYGDKLPASIKRHEEAFALLYSALGYHPKWGKRAMVRQTKLGRDKGVIIDIKRSSWKLLDYNGIEVASGRFEHFGKFLGMEYWRIDFSLCKDEREGYRIEADIKTGEDVFDSVIYSEPFDIKKDIFLKRTIYGVAVANFDERKVTHNLNFLNEPFLGGGWVDCNANMSEGRHHVWACIGFADLLKSHGTFLGPMICEALNENFKWGLDYIMSLQREDGMFIDQHPDRLFGEWGHGTIELNFDCPIALCIGYQMFKGKDDTRTANYLDAAKRGYEWVKDKGRDETKIKPFGVHGGPTYKLDRDNITWTVEDQLSMLWLETLLYDCTGNEKYIISAKERVKKVTSLQVTNHNDSVNNLYGDFYMRQNSSVRTTRVVLNGLIELIRLKPNDPDIDNWMNIINKYAYKYLKPVCFENPFGITPAYIENGKIVYFMIAGSNARILQMTVQLLEIAKISGDDDFIELATNHIQWIVGLHHGILGEFAQPESELEAVPASFINCVGSRYAKQFAGGPPKGFHGPEGLIYYDRVDGKRYFNVKLFLHANPCVIYGGLVSGNFGRYLFGDYYTNLQMGSSETCINADGYWLMAIAKYEKSIRERAFENLD